MPRCSLQLLLSLVLLVLHAPQFSISESVLDEEPEGGSEIKNEEVEEKEKENMAKVEVKENVNHLNEVPFRSWRTRNKKRLFKSGSVVDSLVTSRFTVVSFGYTPKGEFPDWVYHAFDKRFNNNTDAALCSVEMLAVEMISHRNNRRNGGTLNISIGSNGSEDSENDTVVFNCWHPMSQGHEREPVSLGNRVTRTLPIWCIPPMPRSSLAHDQIKRACTLLGSKDLRLKLFINAGKCQPSMDIYTEFTTTMGSFPVSARPNLADDIVIHAVMPYSRVDFFNKIVYHMWLSYHLLLGFHVVSSIANIGFYDGLPEHVAHHPNIAHYDSTLLKAIYQSSSGLYHLPYVVEFEKMALSTFVRFEYRVLYGAQYVVNADPDEFVMAPHAPGFSHFNLSPFKNLSTSYKKCFPKKTVPTSNKVSSLKLNSAMVKKYLSHEMSSKSVSNVSTFAGVANLTFAALHDEPFYVPIRLTNWTWKESDLIGISQQGMFIRWIVNEVFAVSVRPNSTVTNLDNFKGRGIEISLHKQYASTINTTTSCISDMVNSSDSENGVFTFSKCFDYLSVMHPGTMHNVLKRSKYINIRQACAVDKIHHSCVVNNHLSSQKKLSNSGHCMCHRAEGQPFLFLFHLRENGKSGGHDLSHIYCALLDHEEKVTSSFRSVRPKAAHNIRAT